MPSTITALLASTVPAVIPSTKFSSAAVAVIFVPSISNVATLTSPATISIPSDKVSKSVSLLCPIVVPSSFRLSTSIFVIPVNAPLVKLAVPSVTVPAVNVVTPLNVPPVKLAVPSVTVRC